MDTHAEQLQPEAETERHADTESSDDAVRTTLDERRIDVVFSQRHTDLDLVKSWVGLKFYYRAAEKIKAEEAALRKLLDREEIKRSILSEYSFVLDPLYFEQKFLHIP